MNETKRRILEASRALFNQYGLGVVSQRRISEHLGISPGNLTYHFKKSDDIVETLYFELVESMNQSMEELKSMHYDLNLLLQLIDVVVDRFFEYRFIFLDFVHIMRNSEKIKKHYKQLSFFRRQQFMGAVSHLTRHHIMRKEELPQEYDFLYDRFQILIDFWISSAEIRYEGVQKQHLETYKKVIIQSLYPYLTDEGKKAFVGKLYKTS